MGLATSLIDLDLGNNIFRGNVPTEIGLQKAIQKLSLKENQFR